VKAWASVHDEYTFHISVLTLAEYDKGNHNLSRYIAARDALAERFGVRVFSVDDEIVRRRGRISGEVKRASGHAPPVIAALLAATAIEYDLYLVTRDVKDTKPTGVMVFSPWMDDARMFPLSPRTGRRP